MKKTATATGFAANDFRLVRTAIGVAKVCLVLGIVSGCSSNQGSFFGSKPASDAGNTANTNSTALDVYRIRPGDQLSINVFGYDNLSGNFPVGGNGQVDLPQVGPVMAANRSVNELQNELVARYTSTGAVQNPKILVSVLGPQ